MGKSTKVHHTQEELLRKASDYVSASNAHDVALITTMLAPGCSYRSSGTGRHDGIEAIIKMMQQFFAANPDVKWQATDYRWQTEHVTFNFLITIDGATSSGTEELHFNDAGEICLIVVER